MISAGNDIVALKAVDQQRTILPAFYSKFITPAELILHEHLALPFATFVWLLWSVKESVYKYLKRGDAELIFQPAKILIEQSTGSEIGNDDYLQCDLSFDSCYIGVVSFNGSTLYFKSIINENFVASIITNGHVYWGIQQIDRDDYKSQSDAVRKFVSDQLSIHFPSGQLRIEKHLDGYPVIFDGSQPLDIPLSFSHHGNYISYSFQIPK